MTTYTKWIQALVFLAVIGCGAEGEESADTAEAEEIYEASYSSGFGGGVATSTQPRKASTKSQVVPVAESLPDSNTPTDQVPDVPAKVYDAECPSDKSIPDPTRPAFKHIGVDIAPLDHATGRAGAFDFNSRLGMGGDTQFFLPFGQQPLWGNYGPNADWVFSTAPGTDIYSPIDGYVVWVAKNSNWDDWEIIMQPRNCARSVYFVAIDHVLDVQVQIGDRVTAGQKIAVKGTYDGTRAYEGNSRSFEITVGNNQGEAFCPLDFFVDGYRQDAVAKLNRLFADMESYVSPNPYMNQFLGDKFDQAAWISPEHPGCYASVIGFDSAAVN